MKAGEEIVVLPFISVGFKIYAASIVATDKMIQEKPDLVKRFLAATKEVFEWARDNPAARARSSTPNGST